MHKGKKIVQTFTILAVKSKWTLTAVATQISRTCTVILTRFTEAGIQFYNDKTTKECLEINVNFFWNVIQSFLKAL